MQDKPSAEKLLAAARAFLNNTAMPQLSGHAAFHARVAGNVLDIFCLLYTSPSPRDGLLSRMPSSA